MEESESRMTMNHSQYRSIIAILIVLLAGIFVYSIHSILMPFILGALIAYLGDPLVDRFEDMRLNRTVSVLIVFVFLLAGIILIFLLMLPPLFSQFEAFASSLPKIYASVVNEWIPSLRSYLSIEEEPLKNTDWSTKLSGNWTTLGQVTSRLAQQIASSSAGLIGLLGNVVLVPVVGFYLLRDWDTIVAKILELIPSGWRARYKLLMEESDEVISAFVRGQLLVMLSLSVVYSVGLSLVGIQMALVLGVLAGLASIIPYLGFIVGITIASAVGYFQYHDWGILGLIWLVFVIGQLLESVILTPILIGDKVGLHPVAVIFSLMAGGVIAGFVGLLVAIPVAAILMVFLRHLIADYRQSNFYRG